MSLLLILRQRNFNTTDNAGGCGEPKQDRIGSKKNGGKVLWLLVYRLEVDLLAAGAREHHAELKPDEETAERHDESEHP